MRRLITVSALLSGFLLTGPAHAGVSLWEVSVGQDELDDLEYVILRVRDVCSLDGMAIVIEDSSGISQGAFIRFEGGPPVSDGYVFVAAAEAGPEYDLPIDFLSECARPPMGSGRVCLVDGAGLVDCVAYGQFTGDNGSWSAPTDGIGSGQTLERIQVTGVNRIDWRRSSSPDPGALLAGRGLPTVPVSCGTDGGSPPTSDGGLDPTYLEFPDGTLCPTSTLGSGGSATDGGTVTDAGSTNDAGTSTDAGTTVTDAGGGGGSVGGGSSREYEPPASCCNVATGQTAAIFLPVGLMVLWPRRRRRR